MSLWVPVCELEDIVPNTGVCALVGERQVAVFRLDDDSVFALDNFDPFSKANVLSRGIVGDLQGEQVVASPVYKQHFSLATGVCLEESEVKVDAHNVRVQGGRVWVEARRGRLRARAKERLVVIGNGMAAVRALEELLKLAPEAYDITVFGAEPGGSYNRILLCSVLAGEKAAEDIVTHSAQWYAERGIELAAGDPVVRIDRVHREVATASGRAAPYDRLLIATGSKPFLPPIPGTDLEGVLAFRDQADVATMLEAARSHRRAVVIGGGLLGLEAAYGLRKRGMEVTLVHLVDRLMERQLDAPAAALLKKHIEAQGIAVRLDASTQAILGQRTGGARAVQLKCGEEIPAQLVLVTVGIVPSTQLACSAGLPCERGILVNDTLQTFDPRIYAVGECVQHRATTYGLVAPLYDQARVCADHLAGHGVASYRGSVVSTHLKVTGVEVFSAGDFAGGAQARELIYRDEKRSIYKRLVLRDGRLQGAVLYGDSRDAAWYLELMQSGANVARYGERLVFGKRFADIQAA